MRENEVPSILPESNPDEPIEFELNDESATVRIRKVDTRNGVRLEISSPRLPHGIRLDPIALESLTWQTPETFSKFSQTWEVYESETRPTSTEAGSDRQREFMLTNEFAMVNIKRVNTRNGVRLEISSPRLDYSTQLDPVALESLTWQTMDTFSKFLETPFGPED